MKKGEIEMLIQAIQKGLLLIFSFWAGLVTGGIVVTPVIALMNFLARDGPIFPAPLVAFAVVAPVSILLFILQGMVLFYEWISRRILVNSLIWIGLAGGLAAGLAPYFLAVAPYQSGSEPRALVAFAGLGILIGLTVFGCQWAVNRFHTYIAQRDAPPPFITSQ
jgi:hypothetical protein